MKLIQLNAWGGRLIYHLPRFLEGQNPDIVCLQEIFATNHDNDYLFTGLKQLGEFCNLPYSAMSPSFSIDYLGQETDYGIGIIANQRLTDLQSVYVGGQYQRFCTTHSADPSRSFQHAAIAVDGQQLHIINYHGTFIPGSKAGNQQTIREVQMLADFAERFNTEPIIITGDFNLEPNSSSLAPLNTNFQNLPTINGLRSTYSTVLHGFNVVCDYIFVNDKIKVNSFSMLPDEVADHKALILEFDVR